MLSLPSPTMRTRIQSMPLHNLEPMLGITDELEALLGLIFKVWLSDGKGLIVT